MREMPQLALTPGRVGARWQRLTLAFAALAFFADGVGTQAMGLALPSLVGEWHLPRAAFATPTALGLFGFAIGAFGGGLAGDRFGALRAVLGALLLMGLATAGCALAHDVAQLGLWRVLAGLGLGASLPIAASVIAAHAPERQRSVALAAGLAFLPVGGFAVGWAAGAILPVYGWRGLFFACGACAVLVSAGGILVHGPGSRPTGPGERVRVAGPGARAFTLALGAGVGDTLALGLAFFCTVLLYYSMFSWAPTALAAAGLKAAAVGRTLAFFSLGGLVGGLLAGVLVQRFGSRSCLAVLGALAIICSLGFPEALATVGRSGLLPLACAIGLLGLSVIGIQTLLYALGAQVYPAEHRTLGLGIAVGCGRLGAIASSYTGVLALDLGGARAFCGSLALAALLTMASGLFVRRQIIVQ